MSDFNDKFNQWNNTPDTTAEYDAADIDQNKAMGVLAYLSWLVLIPLLGAKNSKFARFHTNQGLLLAIAEIICWTVLGLLSWIPYVGWIFGVIDGLLSLVFLAFMVLGIINAANGKAKELPFVGKFRILK